MGFTLLGILSTAGGGVSDPFAAYWAGGRNAATGLQATIQKFAFASESATNLAATLSQATNLGVGFASVTAGYAGGGSDTGRTAFMNKITFADDSRTTLSSGLSIARARPGGFNSSTAGYAAGGDLGAPNNDRTTAVDKFTFSNDSRTTLSTGLTSNVRGSAGFESATAGYAAYGFGGPHFSRIDKFTFSNDARSTLTGSRAAASAAGFSSDSAGYVAGGEGPNQFAGTRQISKTLFANDTTSNIAALLAANRLNVAGAESATAGYVAGGANGNETTHLDKLDFNSDTTSLLSSVLTFAPAGVIGFSSRA